MKSAASAHLETAFLRRRAEDLPLDELSGHRIELDSEIEELQLTREELAISGDKYSDFYEYAPVGFVTLDPSGVVLDINSNASILLGVDQSQVPGHPFAAFVSPDTHADFQLLLHKVFQERARATCHVWIQRSVPAPVYGRIEAGLSRSGNQCRMVIIDVTERKAVIDALFQSEANCRSIVSAFEGVIYRSSSDYRLEFVNDKLKQRHGRDVTGEPCYRVIHGLSSSCPWCVQRQSLSESVSRDIHSPKDKRWYHLTSTQVNNPDGTISNQGMMVDITDRKQMEDSLRKNEERMRLFFERQNVGMAITSADGRWLQCNDKLCAIFGYSHEEMGRMTWMDVTHPDDLEQGRVVLTRLLSGELNQHSREKRFITKGGEIIQTDISVGCVRQGDGSVDYFLLLLNDVTDRKRFERELLTLHADLEQRVIERTTLLESARCEQEAFSYSVSHDLRGPLRHINSYIALVEEECGESLPPQARHYLDRTRAASLKMGSLIDDLLDLSRIGRAEVVKKEIDLSRCVERIAATLKENDPHRQVEFVIATGIRACGDQALLEIVLTNLLDNAWKYSSRSPAARIEFGKAAVNGKEAYFVKDNGIGFDMQYSDKLFVAFQRLLGTEYEGTGIGLATVKRAVGRLGGTVWAEAKVNEGATFYFCLCQNPSCDANCSCNVPTAPSPAPRRRRTDHLYV